MAISDNWLPTSKPGSPWPPGGETPPTGLRPLLGQGTQRLQGLDHKKIRQVSEERLRADPALTLSMEDLAVAGT